MKKIILSFAVLPVFCFVLQLNAAPKSYIYNYNGNKIELNASKRFVVFENNSKSLMFATDSSLIKSKLNEHQALKNKNLSIYQTDATGDKKNYKSLNSTVQIIALADSSKQFVQPVFEQGGALLIPSDELIVKFKKPTSLSEAETFISQFSKEHGIKEIKPLFPNTFIAKINNSANGRSFEVSQFLDELIETEYAEPNNIVIILREPEKIVTANPLPTKLNLKSQTACQSVVTDKKSKLAPVAWTTLINEGFESATLPVGWQVGKLESANTDAFWTNTTYISHSGTRSCYATGAGSAGVAPPGNYPDDCESYLLTPTLSLGLYEEVYVELWFYARYEDPGFSPYDYGNVGVYDNNSGIITWLNSLAVSYTGDLTVDPTTDNGWRRALVHIPYNLLSNDMSIVFLFSSDSNTTDEGLYIDDIRIVGTTDVDTDSTIGNDTYAGRQYELKNTGQIAGLGNDFNDLHINEAWALMSPANSITVAVIDSGVDLHPDINVAAKYDFDGSAGGASSGSHGTSVAGNIAAIRNNSLGVVGTAPGVPVISVEMGGTYEEIATAINTAVEKGADILNNSWGWAGAPDSTVEAAINNALAAGVIVLFAAGNGPDRSPYTYDVVFPGNMTSNTAVICIGATSPTDEHKAAASSDGQFGWGSSYVGAGPDVCAPGPWSYTTDRLGANGYNDGSELPDSDYTPSFGGTSSATPKACGIVALLMSANPNLTPTEVKNILRTTADDIDIPGIDDKTGAGRINAHSAVMAVIPEPVLIINFYLLFIIYYRRKLIS